MVTLQLLWKASPQFVRRGFCILLFVPRQLLTDRALVSQDPSCELLLQSTFQKMEKKKLKPSYTLSSVNLSYILLQMGAQASRPCS